MIGDANGWIEAKSAVETFSRAYGGNGRLVDEASVDVYAAGPAEQGILGRILGLCLSKS